MKIFTAIVALAVVTLSSHAESAWEVNPLGSVKQVSLEITIGESLALDASRFELFDGNFERTQRFRETLTEAIEASLSRSGISIDQDSDTAILVLVYGRPVDRDPKLGYLCLLEVAVDTFDENDECSHCSSAVSRSHIALIPDSSLEESLVSAAVTILENSWLEQRQSESSAELPCDEAEEEVN